MKIIDAHHHLWDLSRFNYGWQREFPVLDRTFSLRDYQETTADLGVVKSVHVQADVDEEFGLQETRWILSLAETDAPIEGVVAWGPVASPDFDTFLEGLGNHPKLKGIRRLIQAEDDPRFCLRPEFIAGVRQLEAYDLSFDLCIYHSQLTAVIELVRQVPEVSFVLDHAGKPGIKEGLFEPWKTQLGELAGLDNVCCKLSGIVTEADVDNWTAAEIRPYMDHVLEVFGFARVMYGSDWPVCLRGIEYKGWLELVQEGVGDATEAERQSLFYGTAERFYRL